MPTHSCMYGCILSFALFFICYIDTCGFASVYLSCQLDTAIKRNSTRPIPIPCQTIVNIHQRIEPPQENWERHAITIDSTNNDKEWVEIARLTTKQNFFTFYCLFCSSKILKLCQNAMEDPEMPQLDLTAERVRRSIDYCYYLQLIG